MAEKVKTVRNISPFLQYFRNFVLGREHVPERGGLRYAPLLSKRDQPPPNVPGGPAHKLSANAYCQRDGRREVGQPIVVTENTRTKLLADGSAAASSAVAKKEKTVKAKYPGKQFDWDAHDNPTGEIRNAP